MTVYAVIKADGTIRRGVHGLYVYSTVTSAKKSARASGDSVVAVEVDLTREPVFIRKKYL